MDPITRIDLRFHAETYTGSAWGRKTMVALLDELDGRNPYDQRINKMWEQVLTFFKGDRNKALQWFTLPNPMLGNISPQQMIVLNRIDRLNCFIDQQLESSNGFDSTSQDS